MTSMVRSPICGQALREFGKADTSCSRLEIAMDHLDWDQAPQTKRTRDLQIQDSGQGLGQEMVLGVVAYGQARLLEVA